MLSRTRSNRSQSTGKLQNWALSWREGEPTACETSGMNHPPISYRLLWSHCDLSFVLFKMLWVINSTRRTTTHLFRVWTPLWAVPIHIGCDGMCWRDAFKYSGRYNLFSLNIADIGRSLEFIKFIWLWLLKCLPPGALCLPIEQPSMVFPRCSFQGRYAIF